MEDVACIEALLFFNIVFGLALTKRGKRAHSRA